MPEFQPLNTLSTDDLLSRKQTLETEIVGLAKRIGVPVDYAAAMMRHAGTSGLAYQDHVSLLEMLVEIEAIKYTLAARKLRELGEG